MMAAGPERRRAAGIAGLAVLLAVLVGASGTPAAVGADLQSAGSGGTTSLRVGNRVLHRCDLGVGRTTWCGDLRVALDPDDPAAGTIGIGFGWIPATAPTTDPTTGTSDDRRTVVAQEGGPGYPSTGTAADYVDMLGPLLRQRNLLVVDARGTGRSAPISCSALQSLPEPPTDAAFTRAVRACGVQLNHTYRRPAADGGGFVHASDLFTTANSARDLAQVVTALDVGRVDLYGDSYGTYFAQSFLSRYPQLLRSVVLDSAYEAVDLDPWYRTTVTTAQQAFDTVCVRAAACRQATGAAAGQVWSRIGRLAAALRAHPVTGRTVGTDGTFTTVRLDVTALVNIVNDAGYDTDPYRQLDAAARAYLDHRDAVPLLRLYAQDVGYDYSDYQAAPAYYSDGLYMAVACTDYPQLFRMTSPPAVRRRQLAASVAALPADTFAPFSTAEWLKVLPFTETYTGCRSWPTPTHPADPPVPTGRPIDPGHIPVLILNGDLDSLTPAAGGAHIAAQIGSAARAVVAANTVHLVALYDRYGCGDSLLRRFIQAPDQLATLDVSCAARIPEVHAVGRFPARLALAEPATVTQGWATIAARRLATVATQAVGDAATRYEYIDGNVDRGLRGGTVTYCEQPDGMTTASLRGVRWTRDTQLSGHLTMDADDLNVRAVITVRGAGQPATRMSISWTTNGPATIAHVHSGRTDFDLPAP